jgi:preprotein translocase subunit SecA
MLCLTRSGLASLKDELGWGARPDIATVQLASQVDSLIRRREGLSHYTDRAVLAAVTVREHARRYQTVCGLTCVAPPARELERGYGLRLCPISPAEPPALREYPVRVYANDTDRLTDLTRRVAAAHEADRPVLIAVPSAEMAAEVAVALDRARIAHHAASSGDEVTVLRSAGQRGAVTILDLDTCWPPPVGVDTDVTETATPDEPAGRGGPAVLGLGLGSSRRQLDRLRALVRGTSGEIWALLSTQDPTLTGAGSRLLRLALRRDPVVLDGSTLLARLFSKSVERVQSAAETSATAQRMQGWAYASVVQGQRNELLHTRRAILASSDVACIVHRMIDEIVTDWAATSSAQELAPRIAELVPARFRGESGPIDGTEQARSKLHQAYQLREDELGATILRPLERTVLIAVIDNCWRAQLDVLRFLSQHARELYGMDETLTRYQIDADHLGQELLRRVRYDSLRYLFELIVEPAP